MISVCLRLAIVAVMSVAALLRAETPLNEARTTLDKWVETRQLISKTKTDWQSDKEMLEQSIQLISRELRAVEEQMAKLSTNNSQAEKERVQAEASLKSSSECLDQAKQFATEVEGKVAGLLPELPNPLQEVLKPFVNRMPTNSAITKLPVNERMQVLVGMLNEVDKFNSALSIFNEKRANEKGEQMAVETVYVGLGVAYFVNATGSFAGTGSPGGRGWEWTPQPELASSVRDVLKIYRNEQPARFVLLPIAIK